MKYKNILIIKMSSLGDILHTLPFAAALRSHFKSSKISWLVQPEFADFIPKNGVIDEVIEFDKKSFKKLSLIEKIRYFFHMRRILRSKKFDLVIDMQGLFKSAVFAAISGCKTRIGYCEMREFSFLVSTPICGENKNAHVIERYLDVARFLGAKIKKIEFPISNLSEAEARVKEKLKTLDFDNSGLGEKNGFGGGLDTSRHTVFDNVVTTDSEDLHTDANEKYVFFDGAATVNSKKLSTDKNKRDVVFADTAATNLKNLSTNDKYVVFAVGARWKTKEWIVPHFAALAQMITKDNFFIILVGGESEKPKGEIIRAQNEKIIDLTGRTTLKELAVLIKHCAFFVSADTGPLHLATAFKKPLAALYGPTLCVRTGPYANKNASVIVSPAPCTGCLKKSCRDWRCMYDITPEMVYKIFKEKINA
ncbi:MAG: glycosyltransferase family 9 protein [Campylobacteraceae bacterium]|jgi:ADP-heptose:LPS heptosyltransferase|nr:glycosyltransferase family 9 protein [Campylobacteraceae bacterium]